MKTIILVQITCEGSVDLVDREDLLFLLHWIDNGNPVADVDIVSVRECEG